MLFPHFAIDQILNSIHFMNRDNFFWGKLSYQLLGTHSLTLQGITRVEKDDTASSSTARYIITIIFAKSTSQIT